MPEVLRTYNDIAKNPKYEQYQDQIMAKEQYRKEGNVMFAVSNVL